MKKLSPKLLEHLLITMPTMIGVAYFVLWACAPPAALPPSAPMASPQGMADPAAVANGIPAPTAAPAMVTGEIGMGLMGGGMVAAPSAEPLPEAGVWTWLSAHMERPGRMTDLGLVASGALLAGEAGGSMGGYLRVMKKLPTSAFGVEVSGGWLWARLAIPYMKKIDDRRWLYFSPALTGSLPSSVELPVGLMLQTGRFGILRVEGGFAFRGGDAVGPAAYAALSGSLRFGRHVPRLPTPLNEDSLPVTFPTPGATPTPAPTPTPTPTSGPKGPPSTIPMFTPTSVPGAIQPSSVPAFEP
jgi:hypothetical protein